MPAQFPVSSSVHISLRDVGASCSTCSVASYNKTFENIPDNQVFDYPSYQTKVSVYPNNEVVIRFEPSVSGGGDNQEDLLNKFSAKELENRQRIFYNSCILGTQDDLRVVERKEKSGWGNLPSERYFNKKTSQFIVRSLSALEQEFSKENMRFLTMTLPGSTDSAMRVVSEYSAYIVNRTNTFIKRRIGNDGRFRINVWELQKRGALHCHTVIASRDVDNLEKIDSDYQMFCYRLYQDLSEKTGVDMFERRDGGTWKDSPEVIKCKSEKIRKSVSRYMSKYVSKTQSKLSNKDNSNSEVYYPSVWASWGRGMKEVLNRKTVRFEPKRISGNDANELSGLCVQLGLDYSPKRYQSPLIYRDKYGGGVNLRAFVNAESIKEYVDIIRSKFSEIVSVKTPQLESKVVPMEVVYNFWLDEVEAELKNRDCLAKYGNVDERRWRVSFRSNLAPLPVDKGSDAWEQYYASR